MYFLGQFLLQFQAKALKIMYFLWFSHQKIRLSLFKKVKIELKKLSIPSKNENFYVRKHVFRLKMPKFVHSFKDFGNFQY